MKKLIIIIFFSLFLLPLSTSNAQSVDLGIYPPIFEIEANPPVNLKLPFFVQNYTDSTVDMNISLKPFRASDTENGEITFRDESEAFPDPFLLKRIKVLDEDGTPLEKVTIPPLLRKDLILHVQIPSNEEKGEYYFSIVLSSDPVVGPDSNSSKASLGIATNVLLSVGPLGKTSGVIQDFSSPGFVFSGPIPFSVRVKNTSDHYIAPKGDILIKNIFGQTVGKVNLLPVNILSQTIRRIPDSLQSGVVSEKDYEKIKATVEKNEKPVAVWPEKFLLGPYEATLTLAMSDQGPLYKRKAYFFAFPAEYLLGVLLMTALVVFVAVRVRKRITLK